MAKPYPCGCRKLPYRPIVNLLFAAESDRFINLSAPMRTT